jgi:hypothetical protein
MPPGQFRPVHVLGHDRQAVVAPARVIDEVEVAPSIGLAQQQGSLRQFERQTPVQASLDSLVDRLLGVESGGGDVRPDDEVQDLPVDLAAIAGQVPGEGAAPAARADLGGPCVLHLHGREADQRSLN